MSSRATQHPCAPIANERDDYPGPGAALSLGRGESPEMAGTAPAPLRVLVAGGGVAGLETLLALRDLAGDRVETSLLSPEDEFVYRPMAVGEPFSRGHAQRHRLDAIARHLGARLIRGSLAEVDDGARVAVTADGRAPVL